MSLLRRLAIPLDGLGIVLLYAKAAGVMYSKADLE